DGDRAGQVALRHRLRDLGDRAQLRRQGSGELVDVVRQALPDAADALHLRLHPELPFGADFLRHTGDLRGEGRQLVDHGVDRVLERLDLAACVDRDLFRQLALGDGRRDLGDVPHLIREVVRERVDVVGQVLPRTADALALRLAAELAFGADLAGDARVLAGERGELVDHRVDRVLEREDLALDVDGDLL